MAKTRSLCPTCYKEITAFINTVGGAVIMSKECDEHGWHTAIVERDPAFYHYWKANNSDIYDGHLVDVTTRCNLRCKYCYFDKGNEDIPLESILAECCKAPGPYILTGGEPTLRADLPEIIDAVSQVGEVFLLTNGAGFLDMGYLKECNKRLQGRIGLSIHPEFVELPQVIANIESEGIQLDTVFFVIDNLDQLEGVKEFAESHRNLCKTVRIKCASKVWAEGKTAHIFASDVAKWFIGKGETTFPPSGKSVYLPLCHNGITYAIVSWFDVDNVDLNEIQCPPTYTAKDGVTRDFVYSMLVNEGMAHGYSPC